MAVAKARRPCRPLTAVVLLVPGALLLGLVGHSGRSAAYVPAPPGHRGRREAVTAAATAGLAGLAAPLTLGAQPARAEQAWQLRLPRSWRTFSQTPQPPPGEAKPAALVVAGNPEIGGELVVLRVPLASDPKDPNAAATRDLVDYFTKKSGVSEAKVVDAVAQSQKTAPGLTNFTILGKPAALDKGGRRYVGYEYVSSLCQGTFVQGVNGGICQRPGTEDALPTLNMRHSITLTVTPEDTKGASQFLWLLDVSGPNEAWEALKEPVDTVTGSFELGNEEQLEKDRTQDVTPEQLKTLKELQEAGALPQDSGLFGRNPPPEQKGGIFGLFR